MRAPFWVAWGCIVLSCGGSTKSVPLASGGQAGATQATAGTSPSAGAAALANAGAPEDSSAAGSDASAGERGSAGQAGAPPQTFDATCPGALPQARGGCVEGLGCTYGDDRRPWCRPSAQCEGGRWQVAEPACPEVAPCQSDAARGDSCVAATDPAVCTNNEDELCKCRTDGAEAYWRCTDDRISASACPRGNPPNAGQPCELPEFDCYYAPCFGDGFLVAVCVQGIWQYSETCTPPLE